MNLFDLTGKVGLVTGCARGIGQAMAIAIAEAGADVIGVDMGDLGETQKSIEGIGRKFLPIQQNLLPLDGIQGIVEKAVSSFGKIDILINSAGVTDIPAEPENVTMEEYERVININQHVTMKMAQEVYKVMVKQGTGGKIINLTSGAAFIVGAGSLCYTTSKNAVIGITRVLAVAGAKHKICVNAIAPGFIRTKMLETTMDENVLQWAATSKIPAGYVGSPDDLKGIAVFLSSKASDYIMGNVITVDGAAIINVV